MTLNPLDGTRSPQGVTATTPSLMTPRELKDLTPESAALMMEQMEQERKKREWASWVNSEFTKMKNARSNFEHQWYLNLAFTAGKQYVTPFVSPVGFRLVAPKAPPWRVRLVVNKIRTAVRTECSKLTTSKPIPTVLPATSEDEDFTAAGVSEQILKWKFAVAEFEAQYRSWIWWGTVCGNSFLKQYWDASAQDHDSRSLPDPPTFPDGTPMPEAILEEIKSKVPGLAERLDTPVPAVGKINIERVTPFHIYVPDLLSEDLEEQPYLIHVMTKTKEWVQSRFGFEPTCDSRSSNTVLDTATLIAKGAQDNFDTVNVKEVWIKPGGHKDFPKGGVLTVINDQVRQVKDKWPYPFSEFPFYKYNAIPTGGFYSDSIVVDLIPVQKEYNKKRSQAIEIQNTMGKPKLLYQRGSIDPRMISSEPGQSISYTAGYEPPIPLNGVEVPVSFVNEIQQLAQEFDDLSGQHEISRGQTPTAAISSGTAIAYLQEQDDAKLTYQVASIENAMELLGKHYLHLASQYWDDKRVIKITGKNDTFEALHWKKNMLRGNTDVKIQTGSALPFSKAAKTALVTEMMQNGFLDPQVGMEMMNFGGIDKMLDEVLVDKRQAMRENIKMSVAPEKMLMLLLNPAPGPNNEPPFEGPPDPNTGKPAKFNGDGSPFQPQPPIPVQSWDNHEEHIHWHNHYRKTQQFETLSDIRKQAFELHVQLHQIALQAQMVNLQGQTVQDNSQQPEQLPPGQEGSAKPQQDGNKAPGDGEGSPSSPPGQPPTNPVEQT